MKKLATYKPPIIYFGTKHKIAQTIWQELGDVTHYIEPFGGSGVIACNRPDSVGRVILNDQDCLLINALRVVRDKKEELISALSTFGLRRCESDMMGAQLQLIRVRNDITEKINANPEFSDVKYAAYWIYGNNIWLGAGWGYTYGPHVLITDEDGSDRVVDRRVVDVDSDWGISKTIPNTRDKGIIKQIPVTYNHGINKTIPDTYNHGIRKNIPNTSDRGICKKTPNTGDRGIIKQVPVTYNHGISKTIPNTGDKHMRSGLGNTMSDADVIEHITYHITEWSNHLNRIDILCGDWYRCITPAYIRAESKSSSVGIVFDPPYMIGSDVYDGTSIDNATKLNIDVIKWSLDHPEYKIIICSYDNELHNTMLAGWRKINWLANSGYVGVDNTNNKTEMLYCNF